MERYLPAAGRVLLAAIFLMSGLKKITDFSGTAEYMASAGMPMSQLLLVGAIVLEVFGGISLMLGWKTKLGALALIIFLIPASLVFHTNFADQNEMIHFMKNMSILGGLMVVAALGPGAMSLDARGG